MFYHNIILINYQIVNWNKGIYKVVSSIYSFVSSYPQRALMLKFNPFMPNGAFNICYPRDCVSRHNGGTSGAPLNPLRVDSALRALSTLRGLRGAPEVPPLCRETQSLGQQMLNATVGIIGLTICFEFCNLGTVLSRRNAQRIHQAGLWFISPHISYLWRAAIKDIPTTNIRISVR